MHKKLNYIFFLNDGILNLWIILPTKTLKLNVQQIKMISQYMILVFPRAAGTWTGSSAAASWRSSLPCCSPIRRPSPATVRDVWPNIVTMTLWRNMWWYMTLWRNMVTMTLWRNMWWLPWHCDEIWLPWHCDEIWLPWHCVKIWLPWHCDEIWLPWHCDEICDGTWHCDEIWLPWHCDEICDGTLHYDEIRDQW